MARWFRLLWFDDAATSPDQPGHPLYVPPRQGGGRVDDPEQEYRVLYAATDAAGCVAEVFGDFAVWTEALLDPPPTLPGAHRAIVEYELDATVCDLDDPERLAALGLRPSRVVTHDRRVTQRWAREIHDTGEYDGVSWWSRRDARWTAAGLWHYAGATVEDLRIMVDVDEPPVVEAAAVLLRRLVL